MSVTFDSPGFWVRGVAVRLVEDPWEGPTAPEGRRGMLVAPLPPPAPGNFSSNDT